jgi:hypothetical protein
MRTGVRWLLFSLFLLGAAIALWIDFSIAPDHFWLVFIPLISGGGMVWIFCFGRESSRREKETDGNTKDT